MFLFLKSAYPFRSYGASDTQIVKLISRLFLHVYELSRALSSRSKIKWSSLRMQLSSIVLIGFKNRGGFLYQKALFKNMICLLLLVDHYFVNKTRTEFVGTSKIVKEHRNRNE